MSQIRTEVFDKVLSSTLYKFRDEIVNATFADNVLLWYLNQKDKVEEVDGGAGFREHVMLNEATMEPSFEGLDPFTAVDEQPFEEAFFPWKFYRAPIIISDTEEQQNQGVSRIANLLEAKIDQVTQTLSKRLNTHLYQDGTGNKGKNLWGLQKVVDLNSYTTDSYAGFSRSTYSNWQPTVKSSVGKAFNLTTGYEALVTAVRNIMNTTSNVAKGRADIIIGTQNFFEWFEFCMYDLRWIPDEKFVDASFEGMRYGSATITYDPNFQKQTTTSGEEEAYVLNSNHISMKIKKGRNFTNLPFAPTYITGVVAKLALILSYLNLCVDNCQSVGLVTGVTAPATA
jgi:hypothetical protein